MLIDEQQKVREWLARQPFGPGQQAWEPLIGLAEECGELCRAHLKNHQNIRGTPELHAIKGKDAIGDCVIYLLGFCNQVGLEVKDCQVVFNFSDTYHTPQYALMKLVSEIGDLAGVHTSSVDVGRIDTAQLKWAIGGIVSWLIAYCKTRGWSFQECVTMAMNEVMARDWGKNPDSGVPEADPDEPSQYDYGAPITKLTRKPPLATLVEEPEVEVDLYVY